MNESFQLPPIPLSRLAGKTKDFILARASKQRCSPETVIIQLLDASSISTLTALITADAQPQAQEVAA